MPSLGTAYIEVRPDLDNFGRTLNTDMRRQSSLFGSIGKGIGGAIAIGIGAALAGVTALVVGSVKEAQEALEVEAQTGAVLKSTGGAAKITAKEIDNLTTRIMGYAAISDEVVREGVNMLLTFKNIRDEQGKNNDIFTQSTEILADVSVAMGRDMPTTAIMLGKALNDPIKGISAMTRVGIQFTEQQVKQIEKMVEAGDVMGAQKVILEELESQFGGSAEAVGKTKPWEKLTLLFGEMQEGIGKALIPTLNDLADRISKFVQSPEFQQWLKDVEKWLTENIPKAIEKLEGFFADMAEFWRDHGEDMKNTIGVLKNAFGIFIDVATGNWEDFMRRIRNPWQETWNFVQRIFGNVASAILGGFRRVITTILGTMEWMLDRAIRIMEPLPGKMEGPLIAARNKVGDFRSEVNKNFGSVEDKLNSLGETTKKWGGLSRREVSGVANEISNLTDKIQKVSGMSRINIQANLPQVTDPGGGGIGAGTPGSGSLVGIGNWLQGSGFRVSGHGSFGGVPTSGHAPGSYHYVNRAIDVNYGLPGGSPQEFLALQGVSAKVHAMFGGRILESLGPWNDAAHGGSNMHWHLAMDKGGIVQGPATIHQGNIREAHIPLSGPGARSLGNNYFTIYADSTTDGRKLARIIRSEIESNDRYGESRARVNR